MGAIEQGSDSCRDDRYRRLLWQRSVEADWMLVTVESTDGPFKKAAVPVGAACSHALVRLEHGAWLHERRAAGA